MAKLVNQVLAEALANMLGHSIRDVRRLVIDIKPGEPPVVYVERFDNGKLINVIKAFDTIEIRYADQSESEK